MIPPRWAERLLELVLPRGLEGDSILGDLDEELQARAARTSPAAARRWYARQAVAIALRYLGTRPFGRGRAPQPGQSGPRSLATAAHHAVRSLRQAPGFVVLATLTLGVGIGATTAIFSVVDAVLLRPLPYPAAEQLIHMRYQGAGPESDTHSEPEYWDLADGVSAFQAVAAYRQTAPILGTGEPRRIPALESTASLFTVLDVDPLLGRMFTEEDDTPGGEPVVVLSHGLWTRALGADPDVVGTTVLLEERRHTVVGVMPQGFGFPSPEIQAWLPLRLDRAAPWGRNNHYLGVVARLAEAYSLAAASEELRALSTRSSTLYPDMYGSGMSLRAHSLQARVVGEVRPTLLVLAWAVAGVLLIATVNVAGLFLARGERRSGEIAVRTALGAERSHVAAQLFIESLMVSAVAGASGLGLAVLGVQTLETLVPADLPRLHEVGVDPRVLGFGLLASLGTGLIFGLAPAAQAWRADVRAVVGAGTRGGLGNRKSARLRRTLVVAQLSMATVLVLACGVLLRGLADLRRVDLGFDPEHTLLVSLSPAESSVAPDQDAVAFYDGLEERLRAVPGVGAVGSAFRIPLLGGQDAYSLRVEGKESTTVGDAPAPGIQWATPGYFEAMGIVLRSGRVFERADDAGARLVAVVNQSLARELWPGEDPIGRRLSMWPEGMPWMQVVGVVADVRHFGAQLPASAQLYVPHAQAHMSAYYSPNAMSLFVRAAGQPAALADPIREVIREVGPGIPIERTRTMADVVGASLSRERFALRLLALFSSIALVLSAVGVYGVVAQVVSSRTREIGLRMAVGAERAQVAAEVLREGLRLASWGLCVGLAGGVAAAGLVRRLLFGVEALDGLALATTVPVLVLSGAVACIVPAWRASRLDPVEALRQA